MPKLDPSLAPVKIGAAHPPPHGALTAGRRALQLGELGGLSQFGVNLVTIKPGGMSSLRHWHEAEDEFVLVTGGEMILIEDGGETPMRPGDCAAFPVGRANGHHFVNRSERDATFLVVGSRAPREVVHYADIDLKVEVSGGRARFTTRDGRDYVPPKPEGEAE